VRDARADALGLDHARHPQPPEESLLGLDHADALGIIATGNRLRCISN
jgi:hypothetical protein